MSDGRLSESFAGVIKMAGVKVESGVWFSGASSFSVAEVCGVNGDGVGHVGVGLLTGCGWC